MRTTWAGPAGLSGRRVTRQGVTETLGPWPLGTVVTFTPESGSPTYRVNSALQVDSQNGPVGAIPVYTRSFSGITSFTAMADISIPQYTGIEIEVIISGNANGLGAYYGVHRRAFIQQISAPLVATLGTDVQLDPSGAATNYPVDATVLLTAPTFGKASIALAMKAGTGATSLAGMIQIVVKGGYTAVTLT